MRASRGDRRQPGLVDLEQAELAAPAAGVEQRGGHAPGHVRAGAVVHHRRARRARGAARASPRWWSCRSWPRRAPSRRRAGSPCGPSAPGESRSSSRPGAVVPPRAAERGGCRPREPGERAREPEHQAGDDDAQAAPLHAHGGGRGADRVAVGVDDERAVGAHLDHLAAQELDVRRVEVGALEDLGQARAGSVQLRGVARRSARRAGRRRARRRAGDTCRRRRPSSCRRPPSSR